MKRSTDRRSFLRACLGTAAAVLAWMAPLRALAAWDKPAFEAGNIDGAIRHAGVADAIPSEDIVIKAPEIAENGAQVPVEIQSNVPGTDQILIFSDKNVQPYVGLFEFRNGAEPFISTRIKMGDTSKLRAVARAGGKYYVNTREVKVTIGGCGT